MRYLLDSGILLRIVNRDDAEHTVVRVAVRRLKAAGYTTIAAPQNIAEFWNVCTRPTSARGGLGLSVEEAAERLRLVERITPVLPESAAAYAQWKSLVSTCAVMGVQVHDARLAALMMVHGITHILTLNPGDFRRYAGITAVHPRDLAPAEAAQQLHPPSTDAG